MNLGSELVFNRVLLGPVPSAIATTFFENMIYNNTNWQPETYSYDSVLLADSINPGGLNAIDPDLTAFTDKGGKVLHYVGLSDAYISPCKFSCACVILD